MRDGSVVNRALVFALALGACAPHAGTISGEHPANPGATPGRSAGAPPALRPGVATLEDPPPAPSLEHPKPPAPPGPPSENNPDADRAKVDTIEDTRKEPERVDPEKEHPQKVKPIKQPAPKKKPATKPAEAAKSQAPTDHEGHPPKPATPTPSPTPTPAPAPSGHEGHQGHGGAP